MGRSEASDIPDRPWASTPQVCDDLGVIVGLLSGAEQDLVRALLRAGWQPLTPYQRRAAEVVNWWVEAFWFAEPLICIRGGKAALSADARVVVEKVLAELPDLTPAAPIPFLPLPRVRS